MEWVKRIDIKRVKSGVLKKMDIFLNHSLYKKYKILKLLNIYLERSLEVEEEEVYYL